jgi:hypothetical protein
LHYRKSFYRRPPPPRELAPRDPPLELPRLCTTDGLIRTACDLFPLAAELLPADAPLLLPLKRCHPALEVEEAPDPDVDAGDTPRLPADVLPAEVLPEVLPDDVLPGVTRCHPPLLPAEVLPAEVLPAEVLRAAEFIAPERAAALLMLLAERAIACLC